MNVTGRVTGGAGGHFSSSTPIPPSRKAFFGETRWLLVNSSISSPFKKKTRLADLRAVA